MSRYAIQKAHLTSADIRQVVAIHRTEIGQGFLSSLGDRALELMFSFAADSESGVLLVAKDETDGLVRGFLLGTVDTGAFYKEFLRKKSLKAFMVLAPKLLSLTKIRKIMETLLYPAKRQTQEFPATELLDIAVVKQEQGQGLAHELFEQFVNYLSHCNVRTFRITTGENLSRAQQFYEKLGARKVAEIEVHQGQTTYVYIYDIADTE